MTFLDRVILQNIELDAISPRELDIAIGGAFASEQDDIVQVNIVEVQNHIHREELSDIEMEHMFDVLLSRKNA